MQRYIHIKEALEDIKNSCRNSHECTQCAFREVYDNKKGCLFFSFPDDWNINEILEKLKHPLEVL